MNPLAHEIEPYLLLAKGWVPSAVICERFGIADGRALRGLNGQPGLMGDWAISGNEGYKHIHNATTGEWLRYQYRIVHHAISELRRWRRQRKLRREVLAKRAAAPMERDTRQLVFPEVHSAS
jgi:hypothetical protein